MALLSANSYVSLVNFVLDIIQIKNLDNRDHHVFSQESCYVVLRVAQNRI